MPFSQPKKQKQNKTTKKQQQQQQQNIEKSSFFICTFLYIISAAGWKMKVFRLTQPDNDWLIETNTFLIDNFIYD